MTRIEKHAFVAGSRVVEQPVQSLHDARGGGAIVQRHPDVFGAVTAFLERGAHQEGVVDAALQRICRIGIIVNPISRARRFGDSVTARVRRIARANARAGRIGVAVADAVNAKEI